MDYIESNEYRGLMVDIFSGKYKCKKCQFEASLISILNYQTKTDFVNVYRCCNCGKVIFKYSKKYDCIEEQD